MWVEEAFFCIGDAGMEYLLQDSRLSLTTKLFITMKKFLLFFVSAAAAFCVSAAPQTIDFDKLPQASQEFIRMHFPTEKVKSVELDREASWDKYTVYFTSGNQVSFEGGSGDCSQIIMKNGAVPASAVPEKIRAYVTNAYPRAQIVMIQTTADGCKAALADGTELYFDKDGNFVKATK